MRWWTGLFFGVFLASAASSALAQSDPANGYFESEGTCAYCTESPFNWDFADQWGSRYYYVYRQEGVGIFYYMPQITMTTGNCGFSPYINAQQYHVDYADEGFSTDPMPSYPDDQWCDYPNVDWQGYVYIPAAGGSSFARFMFKVTSTDVADQSLTVTLSGYPMQTGGTQVVIVDSGDGDATTEVDDNWVSFDDTDGAGYPAGAMVWQAAGADEQADSISFTTDQWGGSYFTVNFNAVPLAPGETKTFGFVLVQAETRDQAAIDGADLAELGGAGSDYLDIGGVEDSLINFFPGDPTGPRLRSNGPYVCDEGGSVQLGITAEDRDGEGVVTFSWDFNGDGVYGDQPNVTNPTIDCANADGPSSIRSGIRLTDDEGIVEDRTVSVSVRNVVPVITSTPATTATTNQEYTYQITATDIPADTFSYTLDEGPAGMTISGSGLLRWTPPANGIGPDVPVQIVVADDNGGEAEQTWMISMMGGPVVNPGGPYRVAEGDEVQLAITAFDPEDPNNPDAVSFAWDLDSDGVFDDSTDPTVMWSAAGIDGPADGFVVHVVVSDGDYDVQADIPVQVTNAPPIFVSTPSTVATIDREWTYTVQCVDPGDDPFEVTVDEDEMPQGMVFDPVTATFTWIPNEGHLITGDPPGHYCFTITAEDEDRGRSRQDACVTIGRNTAPPVPPIKYPDGSEAVHTPQPTIILDNVDDPDGDPVQYFIEADNNPCFCSAEHMESGALPEGQLVTQWALPRPFNVDPAAGGHTTFYVRRWSSDGLDISAQELSLFDYEPPPPGGDGDADADSDADADADGGTDKPRKTGCACSTTGTSDDAAGLLAFAGLIGLLVVRRRSR